MFYGLPKSVNINGKEHEIRTDFRVILEIIEAINDPELEKEERLEVAVKLFYVNWEALCEEDIEDAVNECFHFIDTGRDKNRHKSPRLMDWENDFEYIIAPVNRVLGLEARAVPYDIETNSGGLHWWTFVAAYMEIGGDCLMSQIVQIRDKQARGKALDKNEKQWLRRNRHLVEFKQKYTQAEEAAFAKWINLGGGGDG